MIEQECFTPTQLQYFSNKFTDSESLAASIPGERWILCQQGMLISSEKLDWLSLGTISRCNLLGLTLRFLLEPSWLVWGGNSLFFFVGNNAADPQSAVDGIHLRTNAVLMRRSGDVSNLKTSSALDIGAVCIPDLTLQRALSALTGKEKWRRR
ncbi:hypothetical protein QWZ10_25080 [Paracoccus cavernae]|uniref:Uncharacterized protein n=1 Tax=Paracoccus cavernae TaxID=1571207 RepID=A0ABT8DF44_9RHOB|nr:hypothetical protein [Paracoccus cavernae]